MPDDRTSLPGPDDVRAAADLLRGRVRRTPVLRDAAVDAWTGAEVHLKAEHLQIGGAFKARGALHAVLRLDDDTAARGVAAHSSGNHAIALALAAEVRGVPCHVVVPEGAPRTKVETARAHGARIIRCTPTVAAREATLAEVVERTGAVEVHPYDDVRVIAGAGTAALELVEDVPDLDVVVVPVGGGGLVSGTAVALSGSGVQVLAAEPAGADDAARSLAAGHLVPQTDPRTVADGLLTSLSPRTFRALSELTAGVVTVDEPTILAAMGVLWEGAEQRVEPSGAVALAALAGGRLAGRRVGVVVSGGNVDDDRATELLGRRSGAP